MTCSCSLEFGWENLQGLENKYFCPPVLLGVELIGLKVTSGSGSFLSSSSIPFLLPKHDPGICLCSILALEKLAIVMALLWNITFLIWVELQHRGIVFFPLLMFTNKL